MKNLTALYEGDTRIVCAIRWRFPVMKKGNVPFVILNDPMKRAIEWNIPLDEVEVDDVRAFFEKPGCRLNAVRLVPNITNDPAVFLSYDKDEAGTEKEIPIDEFIICADSVQEVMNDPTYKDEPSFIVNNSNENVEYIRNNDLRAFRLYDRLIVRNKREKKNARLMDYDQHQIFRQVMDEIRSSEVINVIHIPYEDCYTLTITEKRTPSQSEYLTLRIDSHTTLTQPSLSVREDDIHVHLILRQNHMTTDDAADMAADLDTAVKAALFFKEEIERRRNGRMII